MLHSDNASANGSAPDVERGDVALTITGARLPGVLPPILNDRYKLEGLLGAGGMGLVYRARDLLSERFGEPDPYCAIKLLRDDVAECPGASALLYSEFALASHLPHPNVVRVHGFEVDGGCQRAFFSMQLLRGKPLDRVLCERPQGLAWDELRGIVLPLLEALAFAHDRGVLHGDIKPSNLMLTEHGPQLFDFGLGQALGGALSGLARLSRDRIHAWTPAYAAPELRDGAALSPATDVFAAACLIYELVSGQRPFGADARLLREAPANQRLQRPAHLPARAWGALLQALALEPAQRRISAGELHEVVATAGAPAWRRWLGQGQANLQTGIS
ncbi:serine/threonine-protein kinase [Pseudomonas sp. Marseille-QA0332]